MTTSTRPSALARQLAQLLDQDPDQNPAGPHHHQVVVLVALAHLLATVGQLAHRRAHDQSPGISAANTDPRGSGLGDPTATTALCNLGAAADDTTVDLEHQLRSALTDLDTAARRLTHLITQAVTVHTKEERPTTECGEALCTEAATPGRLGYCETDYQRRYAHARRTNGYPQLLPADQRRLIHQAPPLTRQALADRAIRKRRTTV